MTNYNLNTKPQSRSILLVDDDRLILSTLSSSLTREGYQLSTAESVEEAENWLKNNEKPDLVILDVRMPNRNGWELTDQLEKLHVPFILLTAHSEQDIIKQAIASGAMGFLVKPIDIVHMIPEIETALSRSEELDSLKIAKKQLQTALDADRSISIAVGIVMDQHQVNHDDALELIRNTARSGHFKLNELATNIINSRELLNLRINS